MDTQTKERTTTGPAEMRVEDPSKPIPADRAVALVGTATWDSLPPYLRLDTLADLDAVAQLILGMGELPKSYLDKDTDAPNIAKIKVALLAGRELLISPMKALQIIAVINGIPTVYGDGALGLVWRSGLLKDFAEWMDEPDNNPTAHCRVERKGLATVQERTFSWAQAELAGLDQKQGPWKQYWQRMLQMRARAFCLRDTFPDVLGGFKLYEEFVAEEDFVLDERTGMWKPRDRSNGPPPPSRPQRPPVPPVPMGDPPKAASPAPTPSATVHEFRPSSPPQSTAGPVGDEVEGREPGDEDDGIDHDAGTQGSASDGTYEFNVMDADGKVVAEHGPDAESYMRDLLESVTKPRMHKATIAKIANWNRELVEYARQFLGPDFFVNYDKVVAQARQAADAKPPTPAGGPPAPSAQAPAPTAAAPAASNADLSRWNIQRVATPTENTPGEWTKYFMAVTNIVKGWQAEKAPAVVYRRFREVNGNFEEFKGKMASWYPRLDSTIGKAEKEAG